MENIVSVPYLVGNCPPGSPLCFHRWHQTESGMSDLVIAHGGIFVNDP